MPRKKAAPKKAIKKTDPDLSTWGSHLPVLRSIFDIIGNDVNVLEFGAGKYSTPFFRDNSAMQIVIEKDQKFYSEAIESERDEDGELVLTSEGNQIYSDIRNAPNIDFDVAFVDSGQFQRVPHLQYCFDKQIGLIVLHDSEKRNYYRLSMVPVPSTYAECKFKHVESGKQTTLFVHRAKHGKKDGTIGKFGTMKPDDHHPDVPF